MEAVPVEPCRLNQVLTQIITSEKCPACIVYFAGFTREAGIAPRYFPRRVKSYIRYTWRRIFRNIPVDPEQERLITSFRVRRRKRDLPGDAPVAYTVNDISH
jgi:hypothetical protein